MEVVLNFFKEYFGNAIFVGIVVVICLVTCLVFFIWHLRGIKDRLKKLDDLPCETHSQNITDLTITTHKIENLPCKNHGEKLKIQDNSFHDLDKTVAKIETSLDYISRMVTQNSISNQLPNDFTQQHSPLVLTPEGKEMVTKLGITNAINNCWDDIKIMIDLEVADKTAYDIQQYCMEQAVVFPEKFIDSETIKRVKEDAYTNGKSIVAYMKAVAVIVRDRYFKENNIDGSNL